MGYEVTFGEWLLTMLVVIAFACLVAAAFGLMSCVMGWCLAVWHRWRDRRLWTPAKYGDEAWRTWREPDDE